MATPPPSTVLARLRPSTRTHTRLLNQRTALSLHTRLQISRIRWPRACTTPLLTSCGRSAPYRRHCRQRLSALPFTPLRMWRHTAIPKASFFHATGREPPVYPLNVHHRGSPLELAGTVILGLLLTTLEIDQRRHLLHLRHDWRRHPARHSTLHRTLGRWHRIRRRRRGRHARWRWDAGGGVRRHELCRWLLCVARRDGGNGRVLLLRLGRGWLGLLRRVILAR